MNDDTLVPGDHDGMAAFRGPRATTILVRNHELSPGELENGNADGVVVPDALKWDSVATGGTTTPIIDQQGRLLDHRASLGGTIRNCIGGQTPWETWVTCEENTDTPTTDAQLTQMHGYSFEVQAFAGGPVVAVPRTTMGCFNHQAVAVDPQTGYVYLTEDRGDSAFHRFRPDHYRDLSSGILEALVVSGQPGGNTASGFLERIGEELPVEWVQIEDPIRTTTPSAWKPTKRAPPFSFAAKAPGLATGLSTLSAPAAETSAMARSGCITQARN